MPWGLECAGIGGGREGGRGGGSEGGSKPTGSGQGARERGGGREAGSEGEIGVREDAKDRGAVLVGTMATCGDACVPSFLRARFAAVARGGGWDVRQPRDVPGGGGHDLALAASLAAVVARRGAEAWEGRATPLFEVALAFIPARQKGGVSVRPRVVEGAGWF